MREDVVDPADPEPLPTERSTDAHADVYSVDRAFGSELVSSTPGSTVCQLIAPGEDVGLGWLGPVVDFACGMAYTTTLPAGRSCVTVDIRLDSADRGPRAGERITVLADLAFGDDRFGLARCRIQGEDGRLLGFGIGRFAATVSRLGWGGRDESRRLNSQDELVDALGLRLARSTETTATYSLAPASILENPNRVIHGGVQIAAVEATISDWLTRLNPTRPSALLDLSLAYLLPIPSDADAVTIELESRRIGYRSAVVRGAMLVGGRTATSFESTLRFD